MNKLLVKLLALLGISSVSTGVGGAMADAGVDTWGIAATILGIIFAAITSGKWATTYQRTKNFIDVLDKALEDDVLSTEEIVQLYKALRNK
jgi:hypothetical protein